LRKYLELGRLQRSHAQLLPGNVCKEVYNKRVPIVRKTVTVEAVMPAFPLGVKIEAHRFTTSYPHGHRWRCPLGILAAQAYPRPPRSERSLSCMGFVEYLLILAYGYPITCGK
jgi:hypothetical protein